MNLYCDLYKYDQYNLNNNIKNKNPVLTFLNSNCKCAFVSRFQLFVTALNTSKPGDKIRNTNFARFVSHLHNMKYDLLQERKNNDESLSMNIINVQNISNKYLYYDYDLKYKEDKLETNFDKRRFTGTTEERLKQMKSSKYNKHNIDLFSELILWCSNNEGWYHINDKKYENKENMKINDITSEELERRCETLQLLADSRDINEYYDSVASIIIILSIFPELKQILAFSTDDDNASMRIIRKQKISVNDEKMRDHDIDHIINHLNNAKINVVNLQQKKIELKYFIQKQLAILDNVNRELNDLKKSKLKKNIPKFKFIILQSYFNDRSVIYIFRNSMLKLDSGRFHFHNKNYIFCENDKYDIQDVIRNYKYIVESNDDEKLTIKIYELVGMQLHGKHHSVAFVKNNNSHNSSWNAIDDSSGSSNNNNCKLTDIIDENEYIAREYKKNGYKPFLLLYKKVSHNIMSYQNKYKHK